MKKTVTAILSLIIVISLVSCSSIMQDRWEEKEDNAIKNEINKIINHIVSFETNGGTYIESEYTNELNEPPYTSKEGYHFDGWYFDSDFSKEAKFPLKIEKDTTLHAKWLKLKDQVKCEDTSIKFEKSYYYVTPEGFDLERLEELGYNLTVTVEYDVYYVKTYDVAFDIGYLGSPKYEVSLSNSEGVGLFRKNQKTTKKTVKEEFKVKYTIEKIENQHIKLEFSTDNIQNLIHFENITVTYEFKK